MRKITLLFLLLSGFVYAQQAPASETNVDDATENTDSLTGVEFKPEFPGGIQALYQYIGDNFKKRTKDKGKILLSFVVDQTGKVVDVKVLQGINPRLDKEAVRVLEKSPLWKPAMQKGRLVRCSYQIPIQLN
ncbi:energy transducer TonB [Flavobacterium silvaticum]|uniref:Energy transducer TonB n=1 Tax=Flavobacterium silvaticum TaxID=1852020 RepID=A0A972FPE3_9FLAO|nr:energy transducer TonB [Flavobacterium silvaticum]NMH28960.1 energy transducer TonB [Flavobacterium silvaticum]